jgi:acyl-coenzyme A thioesterase PaaI-like protein
VTSTIPPEATLSTNAHHPTDESAATDDSVPNGSRVALAESLRRLISATATCTASPADLATARDLVDAATAALGPSPTAEEHSTTTTAGDRRTVNPYDSPENPLAPPLRVIPSAEDEYAAELTLSPAYEGPPGRVHGGVVAGILDHASGFALKDLGIVAMSVSLTIDLHDATPYAQPLVVRARLAERDGRKIWVETTLATSDGHTTATCRTLMIELADPPAWVKTMYAA